MILVTGGAGYIGSIVAERLLARGDEVAVYDSLARGYRDAVPAAARLVEADLADRTRLEATLRELPIKAVMHFAAYAQVGESMRQPSLYFRNNFSNALNLLEASERAGVERFVFSSTCAVYGDDVPVPITEATPTRPISPYGESKLAFEKALRWSGLPYIALRYFNACGASAERGERHDPETHLIPLVLDAATGDLPEIKVFGDDYPTPDGTCIRDYIHVLDLADAHIRALEAPSELSGEFNLGTGTGASVREVIDTAQHVTGREIPQKTAPRRPGDPPELVADASLFRAKLGWAAERTLEDAIASAWRFKLSAR